MRAICLRVAGFLLAGPAFAAPSLVPAILTFPELKALEAKVAAHPEDRESAALLGQNYALAILSVTELSQYGTVLKTAGPGEAAAYSRNALAQTRASAVLGPAGVGLWMYSATQISKGAAQDLALRCIELALEMDPTGERWLLQHIQMTISREQFNQWRPLSSREAVALVEADLAGLNGRGRIYTLDKVALLEYRAGDFARAEALARELLASSSDKAHMSGDAVFKGNEVLGLVALKHNDLAGAKQYLRLSGDTKGSPVLGSFGPNMLLAAALADAGEKDAVVAFFEQCRAFWKNESGRLREWTVLVQGGLKPDFGANLLY